VRPFPTVLAWRVSEINMSRKATAGGGPKFIGYFGPLLDALRELGGSGTPQEVTEKIVDRLKVSEAAQQERTPKGVLKFPNQVRWARQYLVWAGLIDASRHGVWSLNEAGLKKQISPSEALALFKEVHKAHAKKDSGQDLTADSNQDNSGELDEVSDYQQEVIKTLHDLTPKGFEHFCKRLLREYGFERVEVTGGPKDKGIDGHGILKINPFVSFRVVFQCKRYAEAVTSREISEFRGSIPANADKGILLTTGYFTADAAKLAQDPSRMPVELVDGEQLVALMEKLLLGLQATYRVDPAFFDEFKSY
jgi:restriction system protein